MFYVSNASIHGDVTRYHSSWKAVRTCLARRNRTTDNSAGKSFSGR
jgi:hypothetical protein